MSGPNIFEGRPDPRTSPTEWLATKLPSHWDWLKPDYDAVIRQRTLMLDFLRKTPGAFNAALQVYAQPGGFYDWIYDWSWMLDPRRLSMGERSDIPFVLFPRQIEMLTWMQQLIDNPGRGESGRGNLAKTRGCGASYCAINLALWHWRFRDHCLVGFGSNLERNVWNRDDPKALFFKVEATLDGWPPEFLPRGFNKSEHLQKGMGAGRLVNPDNRASITGDAGPEIGRSDRKTFYIVDEHGSLRNPSAAEAGLAKTTNTIIRISTEVPDSLFVTQCQGLEARNPKNYFTFDWWQDPRYTREQHDREKEEAESQGMGHVFAIEVDRSRNQQEINAWIPRALLIEAQNRNVDPAGPVIIAVDVAAMGNDLSVVGWRRGLWCSALWKQNKSSEDGRQLASYVRQLGEDLLQKEDQYGQRLCIGAIIYELEGAGYAFHSVMNGTGFRDVLRPIHPGQRLKDGKNYNIRALAWRRWKVALETGAAAPKDQAVVTLGGALRYKFVEDRKGRKLLQMEDKTAFKVRMSTDPANKLGGPSPDEADNCALSWVDVELGRLDWDKYRSLSGVAFETDAVITSWGWH